MWNRAPRGSPLKVSAIRRLERQLHFQQSPPKMFSVSSHLKYVAGTNAQLRKGAWLQRSFTLSIETHSLPALARCYPHSFTFYVAYPIRSVLNYRAAH